MRRKISKTKIATQTSQKEWSLICCRVSSDKQVREGHGLESQEQRGKKYSDEKGYFFEKTFLDEGVSGSILDRPAIREILQHIEKNPGKKYVVIFDAIDRIARDVQVHWAIKQAFESLGARVESPNFKFEDTPEGAFIETILAGKAQLDRQQNARQVVQKMKARLECGVYCFSACPCGMEYKKTTEHGKLLHPKEPEASVIREALEGFAVGRYLTQVDVLNFLLKRKSEFAKGKGLNLNFVKRILSAIVYAGYIEYEPWEVARKKGHHEEIISIETFEKIQAKLKKPEKKVTERDNAEFPLTALICCSICGEKMKSSYHPGKAGKYYPHYFCTTKGCTASPRNIKKMKLEEAYNKLLVKIAPESEIIELTKAIALNVWKDAVTGVKSAGRASEQEIKAMKEQVDAYVNLMPKTKSDAVREKYEEKIETLESEILALKKQTPPSEYLNCDEAIAEVLHFVGTPADYWQKTNQEGKYMLHNLIFTANPVYDDQDGFGTPEISLPFTIKDTFLSGVSSQVDRTGLEPATSSVQMRRSTR